MFVLYFYFRPAVLLTAKKEPLLSENLPSLLQRPFSLMVQAFFQLACPFCLSLLDNRKDQTEGSQNKWSNDI